MSDRTVHAASPTLGLEIVRYDKAGKWFVEFSEGGRCSRSVRGAALEALSIARQGGWVQLGLPGGSAFDRLYRNHLYRRNEESDQ